MSEEIIKDLEREISDLNSEISNLESEIGHFEDRISDLEGDLSEEEMRCVDLEIELAELKSKIPITEYLTNTVKELLEILANHTNQDGSKPYRKLVEKYELSLKFPLVIRK
jgi:predicted  nucleic acid-binding Zn-ribbon protein